MKLDIYQYLLFINAGQTDGADRYSQNLLIILKAAAIDPPQVAVRRDMGAPQYQSGRIERGPRHGFRNLNAVDPHIGWVFAIGAHL